MAIQTRRIQTCLGKISPWGQQLDYLTEEEKTELDTIGYTGKNSKGEKTSRTVYLNSLGKGEFSIKQLKFDSGDFCEEFMVVRVI